MAEDEGKMDEEEEENKRALRDYLKKDDIRQKKLNWLEGGFQKFLMTHQPDAVPPPWKSPSP